MSFLDGLFGGKAKKRDATAANAAATAALNQSRDAQIAALTQQQQDGTKAITSGFEAGRTALNTGFDTARGDLTDRYGAGIGEIDQGMGRARDLMMPGIQRGERYNVMLADALGANGAAARTAFYDNNVRNNSDFAYADELAAKQLQAKLNASGVTGGRAGTLQLRQGAQRIEDRTNQYLDRITGQGARGDQMSTTLAGMENSAGAARAGIQTGLGDRLSGLETNRGTALNASNVGQGTTTAQFGQDNARAIANVYGNHGQSSATNAINYGNALASTRGSGLNSMLQIAGLGIQGFTPNRDGMTPFKSIGNTFSGMFNRG